MKEHFEYQNKFEAFCNEIKDKQHEFGKKKICIYYNGA